jgi:outer membrane protein OmpA-like peptidoglycan-associated protein
MKKFTLTILSASLLTTALVAAPGLAIMELGKGKKSKAWKLKKFNNGKSYTYSSSSSKYKSKKSAWKPSKYSSKAAKAKKHAKASQKKTPTWARSCGTSHPLAKGKLKLVDVYHFPVGQSAVPEDKWAGLDEVLKKLPKSAKILISGHTDHQGGWWKNRRLSCSRARIVTRHIRKLRPGMKVVMEGRAYSKPLVKKEETDEDRRKNRRVEIYRVL